MELPFPLKPYHKTNTKCDWKKRGLVFVNDLAFSIVYKRSIHATQCELCEKVFTKSRDRQMDHCHDTGKFRNIVCQRCNGRKADKKLQSNNQSGYKGICWNKGNNAWQFQAKVNGKLKHIKQMKDLDKLIEFAEKWKVENNYYI